MSFKDIEIIKSNILKEITVIKPSISTDLRGNIYTAYNKELYRNLLPNGIDFIHDKFAESKHNVLRGMHGDTKTWKLISCVYGEIYEVVVDMRPESPTYLKWDAFNLSSSNYMQVLVPPNFLNGYYVKSETAIFHYKLAYDGEYFDVKDQITYRWDDAKFNIKWPCTNPILHDRDK